MIQKISTVLVSFLMVACAHQPNKTDRQLAKAEVVELVTWEEAMRTCRERKAHLPTAREYVDKLKGLGIQVLEVSRAAKTPPTGFYLVDSINPDGQRDTFYMSHAGYRRPPELVAPFRKLWTSSTPPTHQDFAHVFYEEWGGGGGEPAEHHKAFKNAFECFPD